MNAFVPQPRSLVLLSFLGLLLLGCRQLQDSVPPVVQRAMHRLANTPGTFTIEGRLDLAAIGQPGLAFDFAGEVRVQSVLDGAGLLTVSEVGGSQSVSYLGYRRDSGQYFTFGLEGDRTAIAYSAGGFSGSSVLRLVDPFTQMVTQSTYGKDGDVAYEVRVPPSQALLLEAKTTRTAAASGDPLEALLAVPLGSARVNRSADSTDPAENYHPAHELLGRLAGDYTTADGRSMRARLVADGRYLLQHVGGEDPFLRIMSYSTSGGFYQIVELRPAKDPVYMQGPKLPDGSIRLSDPFNPSGASAVVTLDGKDGFTFATSRGVLTVDTVVWTRSAAASDPG